MPRTFRYLFLIFTFLIQPGFVAAESLRWGADAKSGAPYLFVNPEKPTEMQGFEKDIFERVAALIGRKLVFVQNEWESLVPGLSRGDYDIAANGIEITPERREQVLFSNPYYATFEQIVVHVDHPDIGKLSDLNGLKVGTLKASLAHSILERQTEAKIVFYENESSGYGDVESKRIDAFFVDYPIALYYAKARPKLKFTGPPTGKMFYGIALAKNQEPLLAEINSALKVMMEGDELEKILGKWNLLHPFVITELGLNPHTENETLQLDQVAKQKNSALSMGQRLTRYLGLLPMLLKAAVTTLEISILAMFLAVALGLALAVGRIYGGKKVSLAVQTWVELVRGTPLLIQLYLIFFGLPHLGIHLSPFFAAVLGLGLNYSASESENYRAGIEAVPKSQTEAAKALALSPFQRFRHVTLPQAYRIILPPMTNDFIALIKDSSLVSVITMVELTTVYSQLASTYFDHLGLGLLVAAMYFGIGYPFVRLARSFEKKLKIRG